MQRNGYVSKLINVVGLLLYTCCVSNPFNEVTLYYKVQNLNKTVYQRQLGYNRQTQGLQLQFFRLWYNYEYN